MTTVRSLLLSMALVSAAAADEVILKNGSAFTGVVREQGERIVLEMDYGTMTFKKVDVRSVTRGESPIQEFEQRSAAAKDVKGLMELAAWAREKGLGGRATELFRKVIQLDPDQAEARKALGFEKHNGRWLEGDDLMTARGLVKVGGRWLDKDTAQRLQEQEAVARIEHERAELARRMADQRHVEEMTRIGLERERLELEKAREERREEQRWWWGWRNGWGYTTGTTAGYILPAQQSAPGTVPPTPPTVVPLGSPSPAGPTRSR